MRWLVAKTKSHPTLIDTLILVGIGLEIMNVVGILWNSRPFGDDVIYHLYRIRFLATNFPNIAWNPYGFNGYSPLAGFNWLAYGPPAVLVGLGYDPVSVFHATFLANFLLFGLAIYYFARTVGADRIFSTALPILGWSSSTYWNITIGGGAYTRAFFSMPLLFLSLALTYRYVIMQGEAKRSRRVYWILVASWTLLALSDIFVAVVTFGLGTVFLILSGGVRNLALGFKRFAKIILPALGLTGWQYEVVIRQVLLFGSIRQDTTPNPWSWFFSEGAMWQSTLNPVYLPTLLVLMIASYLALKRWSRSNERIVSRGILKAFILSLSLWGIYFLINGWIPSLWLYLPRLTATYNSVEHMTWILLMFFGLASGLLGFSAGLKSGTRMRSFAKFHLGAKRAVKGVSLFFLFFVVLNAAIFLPTVTPADWNPLNGELNAVLAPNLNMSGDYRVALNGRILTRFFPYYNPQSEQTGDRLIALDPNPLYQSWFDDEVFWKVNPSALSGISPEEQPMVDVSSLVGDSQNFAEVRFWLEWYGTNLLVLVPNTYPVSDMIQNYSGRRAFFSTSTSKDLVLVKVSDPSSILTASNASVVGFYSLTTQSMSEYNDLLALLAYVGLGPRYVIPLHLNSSANLDQTLPKIVITDTTSYLARIQAFNTLLATGVNVLVSAANRNSSQMSGNGLLVSLAESLTDLVHKGIKGSELLLSSLPGVLQEERLTLHSSTNTTQFQTFTLGSEVSLSNNGLIDLTFNATTEPGTILLASNNSIVGSYVIGKSLPSELSVTLPSFTSVSNTTFNTILVSNTNSVQSVAVTVFTSPASMSVHSEWLTNQDLSAKALPRTFRGLIWKETYTDRWIVSGKSDSGQEYSLPYYPAGPGLTYIGLNGLSADSLSISYTTFSITDLVFIFLSAATLVVLPFFRRRISWTAS